MNNRTWWENRGKENVRIKEIQEAQSPGAWKTCRWGQNQLWRKVKNSVFVHINLSTVLYGPATVMSKTSQIFKNVNVRKQTGTSYFSSPQISSIWFLASLFYKLYLTFWLLISSFIRLSHHIQGLWRIPAAHDKAGESKVGSPMQECHLVVRKRHFRLGSAQGIEAGKGPLCFSFQFPGALWQKPKTLIV